MDTVGDCPLFSLVYLYCRYFCCPRAHLCVSSFPLRSLRSHSTIRPSNINLFSLLTSIWCFTLSTKLHCFKSSHPWYLPDRKESLWHLRQWRFDDFKWIFPTASYSFSGRTLRFMLSQLVRSKKTFAFSRRSEVLIRKGDLRVLFGKEGWWIGKWPSSLSSFHRLSRTSAHRKE